MCLLVGVVVLTGEEEGWGRQRVEKAGGYHLVDRLDNLEHLLVADLAIAVDVV